METSNKVFSWRDIETALMGCPKFKVLVKAPPATDGLEDKEITTIEAEMLIYKLLKLLK